MSACLVFPLEAQADETPKAARSSLAFYGIVDAGIEYLPRAGGTDGLARITSGNLSASRWGLAGREDLGGGTRAFFTLESGFDAGSGAGLQGGRGFGRLAYIGIATPGAGALLLGRQTGLFYEWIRNASPLKNARYGNKAQDPAFSDRFDNMARYEGHFRDLSVIAQYGFGNDTRHPRVFEAGLRYKHGPLDVAAVYGQKNTGDTDRRIGLGLRYAFETLALYAGYRYLDARAIHLSARSTAPVESSSLYWAGASWHVRPNLVFSGTATFQDFHGSARDPWLFQLGANYFLSKRTDLYLDLGYALNRHGSDLGVNGFGHEVPAGRDQFGMTAGIRHTF